MRYRLLIPAALAVLPALVACAPWTTPEEWETRPAQLQFHADGPEITVPATAKPGVPFNVSFTTFGGGCIEPAVNRVVVTGLDVHIYSTQRHRVGPDVVCTMELRLEQNDVPVTVALTGIATIRVHGRRVPENTELVLTRTVTVGN